MEPENVEMNNHLSKQFQLIIAALIWLPLTNMIVASNVAANTK